MRVPPHNVCRPRSRASSRGGRERVVVTKATLGPSRSLAVCDVDARDYVWLAVRIRRPSSSWAVVKVNARSWRRRVSAARALRRTPPTRRKTMESGTSSGDSFVVDVDAAEDLPFDGFPLRGRDFDADGPGVLRGLQGH